MKKFILLSVGLAFFLPTYGQHFSEVASLELSDSLSFQEVEWVDLDNDSILDIMLFATNPAREYIIFSFRNNSTDRFEFAGYFNSKMMGAVHYLTDLDGDNQVDVVLSGLNNNQPITSVFINKGNFRFESAPITNSSAALIRATDFDGDGFRELLLTGRQDETPFLRILKNGASGWVTVHDSIKVEAYRMEIFNFDSDTDMDFFVSGTDENGITVSRAYYNRGSLYFTGDDFVPGIRGSTTRADLNYDGKFDVVISGEDANGAHHFRTFLNSGAAFVSRDSITDMNESEIFAADFNSDGIVDIHTFGVLRDGDTLNTISRQNTSDTLTYKNVLAQSFGDYERDGDLDVAQLRKNGNVYALVLVRNESITNNLSPGAPRNAVAARIFNRIFVSWNRSGDDHTPVASLTYDVAIQLPGESLMIAEFDQMTGRRLLVTHGNNTTVPYALIRSPAPGVFYYNIQAVDNAFHAGHAGVCKGSGGQDNSCVAVEPINIDACRNEQLTLNTETPADWYSFKDGFLAHGSALNFTVLQPDTLFSVESQDPGCAKIAAYTIQTPAVVKKHMTTTAYVCEDTVMRMGVESHWQHIEWTSSLKGFLSAEDSIDFVPATSDTVKVTMSDGAGCEIQRSTILMISKPEFHTTADTYQILKGESLRLDVAGGLTYQWDPTSGLSDPNSPSPVASPPRTTEYYVTIKDSLGCSATGRILVIVEDTAFIPNLFTPNNDGSNDILKIYGLGAARDFSFAIYNREGNQVFHTENISDAVNAGWDGTSGGVNQPAGLYYWNVRGETAGGKRLQLNGKSSGSIVLLR